MKIKGVIEDLNFFLIKKMIIVKIYLGGYIFIRLLATPWTAAYQAPPPMGFSRQEYWSGVPLLYSLVLLWAVWGQFIFRYFLDPAYTSQDLQVPSCVVGANYSVLIYCICHFQGRSLCLFWLLLFTGLFSV